MAAHVLNLKIIEFDARGSGLGMGGAKSTTAGWLIICVHPFSVISGTIFAHWKVRPVAHILFLEIQLDCTLSGVGLVIIRCWLRF